MKAKNFSSVIASTILLLAVILITSLSCSKSSNSTTPPTPTPTGGGNTVTINIVGMAFPTSTTVKAGTIVTWVNKDGFNHTVTSDDGTTFNQTLGASASFSFTPAAAGNIPYHCNIHSSMKSTLIVTP